jgi:hypothetical protein
LHLAGDKCSGVDAATLDGPLEMPVVKFHEKGNYTRMVGEKLNISHRALIEERICPNCRKFSEYNFNNLFLFRNKHDYRLINYKNIYLSGKTYCNSSFLMPLACNSIDISVDLRLLLKQYDFLYPGAFSTVLMVGDSTSEFSFYFVRDDSDYIYSTNALSLLEGSSFSGIRYKINKLNKSRQIIVKPLSPQTRDDAISVLNEWQKTNDTSKHRTDFFPCAEGINRHQELGLTGFLYYCEERPVGFVVGEEHTKETFVIHFVKGIKEIKGIYEFIYNDISKKLMAKYKYINNQQDLGLPGLRRSKLSYRPHQLINKYRIKLKGG